MCVLFTMYRYIICTYVKKKNFKTENGYIARILLLYSSRVLLRWTIEIYKHFLGDVVSIVYTRNGEKCKQFQLIVILFLIYARVSNIMII